jgi:DNA-binding CsgD family transcriptional regulator
MLSTFPEKPVLIELLDQLYGEADPQACFAAFARAMEAIGFDGAVFVTRHAGEGWKEGIAESTYPAAWIRHYTARGYGKIDPVRRQCFLSSRPFFWSDTYNAYRRKELRIFAEAREYGLRTGMGIPIFSGRCVSGAIGLSSSVPKLEDRRLIPFVAKAAQLFYAAYDEAVCGPEPPAEPLPFDLTPREVEILAMLADGAGNAAAAERLCLSESAVEYHLRNIFRKSGTENRVSAVVKAIRLGLIDG